jgi:hypothetical protein
LKAHTKNVKNKFINRLHIAGGFCINDKENSNGQILIDVIKELSKKLVKLKVYDILRFSRPARITSPYSLHQICGNEWVRTDLLEKAYQIKDDPIERMKYVFCFAISGIHQGPCVCKSNAPFNPILGETYQGSLPDGSQLYIEQTEHHPPSFNYLLYGPQKHFVFSGFGTIEARLETINIILGDRIGKNIIKFDDGSIYSFNNLQSRITGAIMGDRVYNYSGDLIIKDYKNKVECIYTLSEKDNQGLLSKMIFGKHKIQYDEGKIEIKQVNPQTKEKELKSKGYASWIGQVFFDGKQYWSAFDEAGQWSQDNINFVLESDYTKRLDLIALAKGDYDEAQKNKEKLEQIQRDDEKNREKNLK